MKTFYHAILFLSLSVSCATGYAQSQSTEELYAKRRQQANAGQDYSGTELEIAASGTNPKALVVLTETPDGKSFSFRTYKQINPDHQDRIEQRLLVSIPGIRSVEIENQNISVSFHPWASEEDLASLLRILGYTGYEVK